MTALYLVYAVGTRRGAGPRHSPSDEQQHVFGRSASDSDWETVTTCSSYIDLADGYAEGRMRIGAGS
jgi:hypothetical protein